MNRQSLYNANIQENVRKKYLSCTEFRDDLILQNIHRGKLLAVVIIGFETIFLLIDILASYFEINNKFSYSAYLAMYSFMIFFNLLYLFLIHRYSQNKISPRAINPCSVLYLTLIMAWGSIISLMDQELYGHLMSFMVNMIACSIIYILDVKMMSIPYLVSTLILVIGLPFFQSSSNILIGHYINLIVFTVISWTASRISYHNYCDNYVIKALLQQKMKENEIINRELIAANAQLKKLALIDELTGLPNRRSFREFVDKMMQNDTDSIVSIIMIDIDNFKQYNDYYGHDKGDWALKAVATQINALLENTDQIAVRWGGEEFIYIAFNKGHEAIIEVADSIKSKILDLKIPNQGSSTSPYLTISLGTSTGTIASPKNISRIINMADQALYLAKSNGKNCVSTLTYNESSVENAL